MARAAKQKAYFPDSRGIMGGNSTKPSPAPLLTDTEGKWNPDLLLTGGKLPWPLCVFGWKSDLTAAVPLLTPGTRLLYPLQSFNHTHTEPLLDRLGYLSEHTGTSVFNPPPVVVLGAEECHKIINRGRPPAPTSPRFTAAILKTRWGDVCIQICAHAVAGATFWEVQEADLTICVTDLGASDAQVILG